MSIDIPDKQRKLMLKSVRDRKTQQIGRIEAYRAGVYRIVFKDNESVLRNRHEFTRVI
jgi:hypothetical protein